MAFRGALGLPFQIGRRVIGRPLGSLWLPWAPFGSLVDALGHPCAILWVPLAASGSHRLSRMPLSSLRPSFGIPLPWHPFGCPWGALGTVLDLFENLIPGCVKFIAETINI